MLAITLILHHRLSLIDSLEGQLCLFRMHFGSFEHVLHYCSLNFGAHFHSQVGHDLFSTGTCVGSLSSTSLNILVTLYDLIEGFWCCSLSYRPTSRIWRSSASGVTFRNNSWGSSLNRIFFKHLGILRRIFLQVFFGLLWFIFFAVFDIMAAVV